MMIDLAALAEAPIGTDPFVHIVVRNFLPPEPLNQVVADLPEQIPGGSVPPSAVRLGPAAKALVSELESPVLRTAIGERFGLSLDDAPTMLTIRGQSRERDGMIHTDSVAKRVTMLLYLNPASADWATQGGSLRLLRSSNDIDDYAVEVPPVDGTLLAFPNSPLAYHGHKRFLGRRYVIQLNYMTADAAARMELRRHRLSAFVKRLGRAA